MQIVHKSIQVVRYGEEPLPDDDGESETGEHGWDHGEDIEETLHSSTHVQRIFTFQEIVLLASMAGLQLVATYGDLKVPSGPSKAATVPESAIPASEQLHTIRDSTHTEDEEAAWERAVLCFQPQTQR